jgi:hypothetical protein
MMNQTITRRSEGVGVRAYPLSGRSPRGHDVVKTAAATTDVVEAVNPARCGRTLMSVIVKTLTP